MKESAQAVILLYHRVFDAVTDPQLLCVRAQHFAEHLAHLKQRYQVVSLRALLDAVRERSLPERAVAVTFDDGYADNLWNAKPLLERHDVPTTIHVATGLLGQPAEFWWDELENLLLVSPELPDVLHLTTNGKQHTWNAMTPRQQVYRDLHRLLRPLPAGEQTAVLAALRAQLNDPPTPRPTHRVLTPDELRALVTGGLVEIGAHTVTHSMLTSLPLEGQRHEMAESKHQLESILGRAVTSFAYPFGGREMVSRQTIELAEQCGFDSACSTIAAPVGPKSDKFFLPRFLVRDWSGEEFARQLRGFFR